MKVNGKSYQSIWLDKNQPQTVCIIDQRYLPHEFRTERLSTVKDVATAIKDMHLRGAPLIGVAAAYGMYLACLESSNYSDSLAFIRESALLLKAARPTAVDLFWAVDQQLSILSSVSPLREMSTKALASAREIEAESLQSCKNIGLHGLPLIENLSAQKEGQVVNILTHCNAGWLACVDHGTATAPIYAAFEKGIPIHVWVDETRPRNQGARLTAWELEQQGVPFTLITDNTGGYLMQQGMVDMVIVGSDRTTYTGDVANKIGTYLKALAAKDNSIPFYVALPTSTIDWSIRDGIREIPIEKRHADEIRYIQGKLHGNTEKVLLTTPNCTAANYAFDITPARMVTALITDRGVCLPTEENILELYPEKYDLINKN